MILAKSPPLTHLRSLQSSRQISPDKITTLTEGLERILRKAKELHLVESESPHIQKKRSGRSSQTLNIKLNSKIIESASRIAITSPTKHPPKLSRDQPQKRNIQKCTPLKIDQFVLGHKLGSGKFSDVYLCMHKQTRTIYALKTILKSVISQYGMEAQLQKEFLIQSQLDHFNIIKVYAKFQDEFHHFLLMEYFQGQQLLTKFKSSERTVAGIVKQVIDAVMYLHRNGYAHRDLKPQNILIDKDGRVKILDFGWAAECRNELRNTFCGTYDYLSPQVLAKKVHNIEVDIWAIGILTYEMLSGQVPFKDIKNTQFIQLERITFPKDFSERACRFISLLLMRNPHERINLHNALDDPFISQATDRTAS